MRIPSSLSRLLSTGLLCALTAGACGEAEPVWEGAEPIRWRALSVRGNGEAGFTRMESRRSGIGFVNDPSEEMTTLNQHLANGAGVALGDVDGDGRPDVFLVNTRGENALYLNRGGMRFELAGPEAGVHLPDRHPTGAVMADVDGDADLDLLLSAMGAPLALLENDGTGHFTDRSAEVGFGLSRAGSTMTLADVDGDGDLDLYAANYRLDRAADVFSPADRRETPILEERNGEWVVNEMYRDYYRVVIGPEGVMSWEFGEEDDLWLNDGSGRFERVGVTGDRFRDAGGVPLGEEPQDWGLSARFGDLDGDGDPDLYVANDFESPDHLWLNDGTGRFTATGAPALRKTSHASMSVAFADVDGNGATDVFVADMLPLSTRYRKTQVSTLTERRPMQGDLSTTMQVNRNTLLLATPGAGYVESAQQSGVAASGWTWGTEFVDVDLDGDPDLLAANGHRWDPLDADTGERLRNTPATAGAEWHEVINLFPQLRLPNRAFRNAGDGSFELVEGAWGLDVGPDISHGLATGDLDGDGDLDVVVNRLGDEALLMRNDSDAPRLAVRLVGRAPNTAAIGARITVLGGPREQTHEVGAGGLYLSHADGTKSFAAGEAETLTIEVRWPDGSRTTVADARPNRLYEIGYASAEAAGPRETAPDADAEAPIFAEVTLPEHAHVDRPFDPRPNQRLIPRSIDRLGPGLTWNDVDRDGDPDLIVGGGTEGRVALFRNDGGRFGRVFRGGTLDADATTILPEPAAGRHLVGQANWEVRTVEEARAAAPALSMRIDGSGPGNATSALSTDGASTGALASADVDGDGDLDLFVGGRAYQGAYPIAPLSHFFRRMGDGSLQLDSAATVAIGRIGMVSAATFTDLDGDTDPDLVLAVDWGPPRILLNDGGRFFDRTREWGLGGYAGWWNGVAAGDFDADGRMDLVLTSWGTNTGLEATSDRPLMGYWGDFDRSGALALLLARRDDRLGGDAPLADLLTVSNALPFVRRQTTQTFAAYAEATIERLLGPSIQAAQALRATTLEHTVFLNRGGSFEAIPLPAAAQRAPAHGVAVADVDGDGAEDLLLAQNFFPNAHGAERHDAGNGLLLLGDGRGGFRALTPVESGISVPGDQRGLAVADFDADGRVDFAVGQNSGPVRLLRNQRAAPGLRVRLEGGPTNPRAVGASLRVVYGEATGPRREVRLGSGFWSVDGEVQVLGLSGTPTAVEVRWPDGELQRVRVESGATEVTVRR